MVQAFDAHDKNCSYPKQLLGKFTLYYRPKILYVIRVSSETTVYCTDFILNNLEDGAFIVLTFLQGLSVEDISLTALAGSLALCDSTGFAEYYADDQVTWLLFENVFDAEVVQKAVNQLKNPCYKHLIKVPDSIFRSFDEYLKKRTEKKIVKKPAPTKPKNVKDLEIMQGTVFRKVTNLVNNIVEEKLKKTMDYFMSYTMFKRDYYLMELWGPESVFWASKSLFLTLFWGLVSNDPMLFISSFDQFIVAKEEDCFDTHDLYCWFFRHFELPLEDIGKALKFYSSLKELSLMNIPEHVDCIFSTIMLFVNRHPEPPINGSVNNLGNGSTESETIGRGVFLFLHDQVPDGESDSAVIEISDDENDTKEHIKPIVRRLQRSDAQSREMLDDLRHQVSIMPPEFLQRAIDYINSRTPLDESLRDHFESTSPSPSISTNSSSVSNKRNANLPTTSVHNEPSENVLADSNGKYSKSLPTSKGNDSQPTHKRNSFRSMNFLGSPARELKNPVTNESTSQKSEGNINSPMRKSVQSITDDEGKQNIPKDSSVQTSKSLINPQRKMSLQNVSDNEEQQDIRNGPSRNKLRGKRNSQRRKSLSEPSEKELKSPPNDTIRQTLKRVSNPKKKLSLSGPSGEGKKETHSKKATVANNSQKKNSLRVDSDEENVPVAKVTNSPKSREVSNSRKRMSVQSRLEEDSHENSLKTNENNRPGTSTEDQPKKRRGRKPNYIKQLEKEQSMLNESIKMTNKKPNPLAESPIRLQKRSMPRDSSENTPKTPSNVIEEQHSIKQKGKESFRTSHLPAKKRWSVLNTPGKRKNTKEKDKDILAPRITRSSTSRHSSISEDSQDGSSKKGSGSRRSKAGQKSKIWMRKLTEISKQMKLQELLKYAIIGDYKRAICRIILSQPSGVNGRNKEGLTPLHLASRLGQLHLVGRLVKIANADLNAVATGSKKSALHFAVEAGSIPIASYLLRSGIQIDLQDADGLTPLDLAIKQNSNNKLIEILKSEMSKRRKIEEKYS